MANAAHFRSEAARCRSMARLARDKMTAANLLALAADYEAEAERLEPETKAEPPMPMPD